MNTKQQENFKELSQILAEVYDLRSASSILSWDQSTYMPEKGAAMRGRQLATMGKLAHEKFVNPTVKSLLQSLEGYGESFAYSSYEASLLRTVKKEFEREENLSPQFVTTVLEHQAACYDVWIKARAQNNFSMVAPFLEKTLQLSKEYAQHFDYEHIADPLIAQSDEGFTTQNIKVIFQQLRNELVPLVQAVLAKTAANDSCLKKHYPLVRQQEFNKELVHSLGFDFKRGRLDTTHHPFMTSFAHGDVRITTRYKENDLS